MARQQKRDDDPLFYPPTDDGSDWYKIPVNVRLDKFREKAVPLVSAVCKKAVDDAGISMEDIGKLVVVSSTGFLGPGLDCAIIEEIGLSRGVDRECPNHRTPPRACAPLTHFVSSSPPPFCSPLSISSPHLSPPSAPFQPTS